MEQPLLQRDTSESNTVSLGSKILEIKCQHKLHVTQEIAILEIV